MKYFLFFFFSRHNRLLVRSFFFSCRSRHTRWTGDWSSDVCSSDLDDGFDVLCHSLGAVLWLHHVHSGDGPRPARVALVCPPSPHTDIPELAPFLPVPLEVDVLRHAADGTVLVCSDNDPYCPEGAAAAYGRVLKMPTTVIPGAGHLNVEAGYGSWPAVLDWCGRDNLAFIG